MDSFAFLLLCALLILELMSYTSLLLFPVLNCTSSQFKCADGSSCINSRYRCDGVYDCKDNSDEAGCRKCHTHSVLQTKGSLILVLDITI